MVQLGENLQTSFLVGLHMGNKVHELLRNNFVRGDIKFFVIMVLNVVLQYLDRSIDCTFGLTGSFSQDELITLEIGLNQVIGKEPIFVDLKPFSQGIEGHCHKLIERLVLFDQT